MKLKMYVSKRVLFFGKTKAEVILEADTIEEFKELAEIFGRMELKAG